MKQQFEVLIIGGGPAGLSAGLSLGRMSRTALICDDSRPRNAPSSHANNFATRDGIHPAKWREFAREDLSKYKTVSMKNVSVLEVVKSHDHFHAKLSDGTAVAAKRIVLAYGIADKLPALPGFKENWGHLIYHCPFCHGYEVRNQKLAYFAQGPMFFHALPLVKSLTDDLIFLTNGTAILDSEQKNYLLKNQVKILEEKVIRFTRTEAGKLEIAFENGATLIRDGAFAASLLPLEMKSKIGEHLGCKKNEFGLYEVDVRGATSVAGVYAAGDNSGMNQSVIGAAAMGNFVGAQLVFDLTGH